MKYQKVAAVILTGSMVMAAGMQAAALPSVTGGGAQTGNIPAEQVVTPDTEQTAETEAGELVGSLSNVVLEPLEEGTVVWEEIKRENYTEEQLEIIDLLNNAETDAAVEEVLTDMVDLSKMKLFSEDGKELEGDVEVQELLEEMRFLSPVLELKFTDVVPTKEKPVYCTFTVNNMTEDMDVYLLYACEEDGWELLGAKQTEENQVKVAVHGGTAPAALTYCKADEAKDAKEGVSPMAEETETEETTEQ